MNEKDRERGFIYGVCQTERGLTHQNASSPTRYERKNKKNKKKKAAEKDAEKKEEL